MLRPPYSTYIGIGLMVLGLLLDMPFFPVLPPSIESPLGLKQTFGSATSLAQMAPLLILGPLLLIGGGLYLLLRRPKPLPEEEQENGH